MATISSKRDPRNRRRRSLERKKRSRVFKWLTASCLIGLAAFAFGPTENWVFAPGVIVPKSRCEVRAPIDGEISDVLVRDADCVFVGQPVISFDRTLAKASLTQAISEVTAKEAELQSLLVVQQRAKEMEKEALFQALALAKQSKNQLARILSLRKKGEREPDAG